MAQNPEFEIDQMHKMRALDTKSIDVEDLENESKKALFEYLEEMIASNPGPGNYTREKEFENAFVTLDGKRGKLKSVSVTYDRPETKPIPITVDYSKELVGVVEFLSRSQKLSIFRNGKIVKEG
jgi:hypothetical protein